MQLGAPRVQFNAKFFHAKAKFTLVELGQRQDSGKDLDVYVRRFHKEAVGYCDLVEEEVFVNFYLEEYKIFLENLSLFF